MISRVLAIFAVILAAAAAPLASAQEGARPPDRSVPEEFYSTGQQSIQLSVGLFIPLFFQSFSGTGYPTNLSLGASGSLQYGVHLGNRFMVGLEIGGSFNRSVLENYLLMMPIVARGSYIFYLFPIEIPVSMGLGMNLIKYESQSHIDLILRPGVSPMWKYNSSWSFGLNLSYWWIFQFATGNQDPDQARMGHFLSIMPMVQYSF